MRTKAREMRHMHKMDDDSCDHESNAVPTSEQDQGVFGSIPVNPHHAPIHALRSALEASIIAQGCQDTGPLPYFGSLMTLLSQGIPTAGDDEESLLGPALYLLDKVLPKVPQPILRLKAPDVSAVLGSLLSNQSLETSAMRSALGSAETLLRVCSVEGRAETALYTSMYRAALSPKPKIRRRGSEAIVHLLGLQEVESSDETNNKATMDRLAISQRTLDLALQTLPADGSVTQGLEPVSEWIHLLTLLRSVMPELLGTLLLPLLRFGTQRLQSPLKCSVTKANESALRLCQSLLGLPQRAPGAPLVAQLTYGVLDGIVSAIEEDMSGKGDSEEEIDQADHTTHLTLLDLLTRSLIDSRPFLNDANLMPVWLALVGRLFRTLGQTLARLPPSAHTEYSTEAFPALVVRFVKRSLPVYLAPTEPLKPAIVAGAGMALCQVLTECLTDSMVSAAQSPETAPAAPLTHLIRDINSALKDIRYQAALGAVLTLTEALVIRLGRDSPDLVSDILKTLGEMRDSQAYGPTCAVKENLEGALETAAQAMGIEKFLARLPLNIENELPNEPRRPYLLATLSRALAKPLPESSWVQQQALGSHSLVFYTNTLLPLAQRLLSKAEALWVEEPRKEIEGKLYETLGMQVLGLLPILCGTAPADAAVAFGSLAPVLGEILTAAPGTVFPGLPSQPDLRPLVCDTLHQLARRYVELLSEDEAEDSDEVASESAEVTETLSPSDKAQVEANINAIVQFNDRFLGALCNIYTTPPAEIVALGNSKGQALQALHERQNQYVEKALKSLLQLVSEPSAIESYFVSLVQKLLELQTETKEQEQAMDTTDGIVASQRQLRMFTILDLLLILLPFIADDGATVAPNTPVFMYYQVLFGQLQDSDVGVQKKTYKALQVLLDTVTLPNETLMELAKHLLEPEVLARCPPGSKKSRMGLIQSITTALGASESPEMLLRWIPICLPEVMLASKEVSEKARNAAFDCLVAMGWTMQARGEADSDFVGKASAALEKALEDDEDADSQSAMDMRDQAPRSPIEELFTMVLAGLAGTTAHMQSATIGSIGRLFYEFYDHLSKSFVMDVIDTVFLFLGTKSREILKSALGFMKVVIALCDNTIIEHFLQAMVSRVLSHTKEEKSHFKTKIRHIMERLIRKFGIEKVDVLVPEADRKLILNIRKRRERLKKKKSAGDAGEEKKEEGKQKYEDAIYGSESDLDSDKEESSKAGGHSDDEKYIPESLRDETRQKSLRTGVMLHEGQDDVLDFLGTGLMSSVTSTQGSRKNKDRKSSDKKNTRFNTSEDGKLVFEESGDEQAAEPLAPQQEDFYKQSLRGEAAFVRTADGKIKFLDGNQSAKKRGRDTEEETGGRDAGTDWRKRNYNKKAKNSESSVAVGRMLGQQYRSSKARGDVKKAGMADPHAYIPLSGKIVGNKRKSAQTTGAFKNVIRAAKEGGPVKESSGNGNGANKRNTTIKRGNKKHNK